MTHDSCSNRPLVSVVIPTCNRNEYLTTCLEGVAAQSYDPLEVIVIDDSGTAQARQTVAAAPVSDITYIPLPENTGPAAARNRGISIASGRFVQLLDDDDVLHPEKIAAQVSAFETGPDVGIVYCGFEADGIQVRPTPAGRGNVLKAALTFDLKACVTSTMLFRSAPLDRLSPLPETPGADDTYWKIELATMTSFEYVDNILVTRLSPPDRRASSRGAVEGTHSVLEEYRSLYDSFDDAVFARAKADALTREAFYCARTSIWSPRAITLSVQACRIHPSPSLLAYVLPFVFSLGTLSLVPSQALWQFVQRHRSSW